MSLPPPDDLELLLLDIRKTIGDNRLFLDKLVDETPDEAEDGGEAEEPATSEDDFEEL